LKTDPNVWGRILIFENGSWAIVNFARIGNSNGCHDLYLDLEKKDFKLRPVDLDSTWALKNLKQKPDSFITSCLKFQPRTILSNLRLSLVATYQSSFWKCDDLKYCSCRHTRTDSIKTSTCQLLTVCYCCALSNFRVK